MTPRVRWTCPSPDHPGVLAPARLRKVDVRRYCLPCSEAAGILVEREAPRLSRRRDERARALAVKRARKARTVRTRETANRDARLANYARYCGPAVVAKALGITRERAAERLAGPVGADHNNRGTPSSVLRRVLVAGRAGKGLPPVSNWLAPIGPRPTLAQWRKAHPGATAVVIVTGHYVYVSHGRLIEHNGRKSSRARVRAWLDLSQPEPRNLTP